MDSNELTREVFAHFGLAGYLGQVLEEAMVGLLIARRLPDRRTTPLSEIEAIERWARRRTMGQVTQRLRDELAVDDTVAAALSEALAARNELTHGYFAERAAKFCTHAGCVEMLDELIAAQETIQRATNAIEAIVRPLRTVVGIDDELVLQEMVAMVDEA